MTAPAGDALVAGEQGRFGHLGQGYVGGGVVGGEVGGA